MDAFTLFSVTRFAPANSSVLMSAQANLTIIGNLRQVGIKADSTGIYFDPATTATTDSEPVPTTLLTFPSNAAAFGNIRAIGNSSVKLSVYQYG